VLVYANFAQFGSGERSDSPFVESRMLLLCKAGRGRVRVNRTLFEFAPGSFLFLPWGHSIAYEASARDPFLLIGVHLIPRHATDRPVVYQVAYRPSEPLAGCPWRRDGALEGLDGLVSGNLRDNPALGHLAEYIVHAFMRGPLPEARARHFRLYLVR
jgi:hypothetical protein